MSTPGKLIVITGPAGVGKSTIVRQVLQRTGAEYSISATTRRPRPGEVDGRDYRFVSDEEFQRMVDAGDLLEWAEVFKNRYGTPAAPVREALRQGRRVVLEIDVQGGLQVARTMPDATFVLILPPSEDELGRRLRGRGTEDEASFQRRFGKASQEIALAQASGVYRRQVVNDDLEKAVEAVVAIVNDPV